MLKKCVIAIASMVVTVTAIISHAKDDIRIPDKHLHYSHTIQNLPPTTVFRGKMLLEGELLLSWYKVDYNTSKLNISFTPSPSSREKLPFINDPYNEQKIVVGINELPLDKPRQYDNAGNLMGKHTKLPNNIDLVKPYFPDIPTTFWQNKRGEISRPAQVTITEFGMENECDSRNYYATAVAIRPLNQNPTQAFPAGC